jgi:hypothetical protein
MTEDQKAGHPLDNQNRIERAIQLEGSKDPDKFKMPDGRTLTEVRNDVAILHADEYQKEIQMVAHRTRESSIPEFTKGKDLVMTRVGNLVDVTSPPPIEDNVTMATSRTTSEDIAAGVIKSPGSFEPPKSMEATGSFSEPLGMANGTSNTTPPVPGTVKASEPGSIERPAK